ncbi:MAG TPA: 4-alpha-glucanotransferase [Candidatus Omnitrophota bacterium]|nr:4-alpha-glucanotransferase [Candidatus Omnitrophota bacterium]HRZ14175.1 4-alpha-glucanotransferase [Candidatus Omnitrophota bacterium]
MTAYRFEEKLLQSLSADKWKRVGTERRSGVVVPLFSVYSENSAGVGDLADLKLLIDWCEKTGNTLLQLLPMNEVGPIFCPYDSLSSFALDPMYLSLGAIKEVTGQELLDKAADLKRAFPTGASHLDYRIKSAKLSLLWEFYSEVGESLPGDFTRFCQVNSYWLEDFSLFCFLKFIQGGKAWWDWEERFRNRDTQALAGLKKEHAFEIAFYSWMQWQLFRQMSQAKEYAASRKVLLKGDLPILVSEDSADVWAHRGYFKMDFVAGAPPDMYCAKGQRWGTPTYEWDAIFADGGRYLKEKLAYAENFYDILRIDHVVGLFRIWSIPKNDPLDNKGLNGAFDPREEFRWEEHGKRILRFILENTRMLLCAEDLGVIPPVCTSTLKEFAIPGNDVQRWIKDWNVRHDFLPPEEYRPLAVSMLSTHDTTNWPAWWECEAGTIDENLFVRLCCERGIKYNGIREKLFDLHRSSHGRVRWSEQVTSVGALVAILGKKPEEVRDFIDMYENSFHEKEKLWQQLRLKGPMREKCDREIVFAIMRRTLEAQSIFCVNLITDWLFMGDILKGDPYLSRINTPGTVIPDNWSVVMPLSLEELLRHSLNLQMKEMITATGRSVQAGCAVV